MSYWDTACLVKLYTPEPNSAIFRAHLAASSVCLTCDIAPLEFWTTVRRKEAEGALAPGEAQRVYDELEADIQTGLILIQRCDRDVELEFHDLVDRCLAATPPVPIRTNDALHLAGAIVAGETEIVATDKRMRDAALLLGLSVVPAS
jgi:predicted nucleic acid-binding protein